MTTPRGRRQRSHRHQRVAIAADLAAHRRVQAETSRLGDDTARPGADKTRDCASDLAVGQPIHRITSCRRTPAQFAWTTAVVRVCTFNKVEDDAHGAPAVAEPSA